MQSQTISQTLYKLTSASDLKLARRLGDSLAIVDITHGDKSARVTPEYGGRALVVEYSGEVYELETISDQAHGRVTREL